MSQKYNAVAKTANSILGCIKQECCMQVMESDSSLHLALVGVSPTALYHFLATNFKKGMNKLERVKRRATPNVQRSEKHDIHEPI